MHKQFYHLVEFGFMTECPDRELLSQPWLLDLGCG